MVEGSNPFEPAYCLFLGSDCMKKFALQDHELVPAHILLSPEESEEMLKSYGVDSAQLPKIHVSDPVVKEIGGKVGDVVKIIRKSPTSGESVFYRLVID
ncbi:MAG: DNA-directed RNA polymerase subunit H [Methanothrix harundinacea]|uniref:DNA-directed RNA polymerase subunit Rpo5 n=1 Tax=Methanothrix harundinacea TaxID=301375 RepID=A0A117LG37_9EURY|nr:MAG: DNA-directed RNA polymerase subunit H [Methanothrix harundinacea]KUK96907.1 MAG: DNA-directed RNA polymerase subunit H [Methanothrix harundinacea]